MIGARGKHRLAFGAALILSSWIAGTPSLRADPGADDVGFALSDSSSTEPQNDPSQSAPSPWTLVVSFRSRAALRVESSDLPRLANLRQLVEPRLELRDSFASLQLHAVASLRAEADLAYLADSHAYDIATREQYAWQILPGENYLALSIGALELSFGEQIVSLGQGEVLSVLDVINPRDLREPLLTDISDLRLPSLISRAKLSFEHVRAELLIVHEAYFGLLPPPLGEFSPFRKLLLGNPAFASALATRTLRNRAIPSRDLTDLGATQIAGRVAWSGPSVDLAVLAGSVLDSFGTPSLPAAEAWSSTDVDLPILHSRYTLLGHSGAYTLGAFVLRWEAAVELGRALALRQAERALQISAQRRDEVRVMMGLTYAPSESSTAGLEVVQSYVFANPARRPALQLSPLFPVEATQIALRANHHFFRDRASVSLLMLLTGIAPLNAFVGRIEIGYKPFDSLEVSLGFITYQPTREFGYFYGFERDDRIFLNLRWDVSS